MTTGQKSNLFNVEAYQVAKTMHINTMSCLKSYIKDSKAADTINTYKGKFGRYDEKLGAKGKTNSEKWTQDRAAIMTLLPDLQFFGTKAGQGNVEDELIRGISELFGDPNKRLSVWLLWALNVWLDILQGLGFSCGQAYRELKQESLKIQKALLNLPATPERKEVLQVVTRWNRDPTYIARMTMLENGSIKSDDLLPEFTFLRRHPTFCGLLLHHYRSHLHWRGVEVAAHSGGLMCTTQLYHALRNENRLSDKRWEDLETLWKFQGDPCFFVGGPPKDREGYYRNFSLCVGVSATNWAPNRRDTRPVVYKKNAPNMKRDGWVSLHVFKRHLVDNKREPWTVAYVAELLADGRIKAMQDGKGRWYAHIKGKEKEVGFTSFYDEIPANAIQLEPLPSTPRGIINYLAQHIDKEVPRIAFNYFNMHYIAWDLLTRLKNALLKVIGPEFLNAVPNEDQLPLVVGYIFSTAAGHGNSDVRKRDVGNDTFIDVATEVINDFLDSGMGSWITTASQQEVDPKEVEDLDVLESLSTLTLDGPAPRSNGGLSEEAMAEYNRLSNDLREFRSLYRQFTTEGPLAARRDIMI
jgi:hypothetical protein